ncbi:hypothetical protein HY031_01390 [Candidatus Gottesmanbacteria bacterium]|nr:hypothetical protein [Candidatus Gottesmanbacteria bacterium]MBI3576864.1 hypothetical protein [Candidatus Gottesmanbacteria bacterium]
MMGNWGNYYGGGMMGTIGVWGSLTWLLVVVFLVLGIIYFWKEINRKK